MRFIKTWQVSRPEIEEIAFAVETPKEQAEEYLKILLTARKIQKEYNLHEDRILFIQSEKELSIWVD